MLVSALVAGKKRQIRVTCHDLNCECQVNGVRIRVVEQMRLISKIRTEIATGAMVLCLTAWMGAPLAAQSVAQVGARKAAARFATVSPGEKLENLDLLKEKLEKYHACTCRCGCYAHDLDAQAAKAIAFLKKRTAGVLRGEKLALVLDIDETTLSNYEEMEKKGFAYDAKAFAVWENEAAAPAIPGTLKLYKEAQRLGVAVFFLTGRPESERAATERDLQKQGFEQWQELILRSASEEKETAKVYKSAERGRIEKEGYRIVLNVGDQWSDLRGVPEAEYSVKYPNPYYFIR